MLSTAVYHFADEAIVPVKVDYLGVGGAARHTQNIIEAQAKGLTSKWGGVIVPTFVRAREILARQMLAALVELRQITGGRANTQKRCRRAGTRLWRVNAVRVRERFYSPPRLTGSWWRRSIMDKKFDNPWML